MDLKNKVALITGGARIGVTVANEIAKKGCHVVVTYRSSKKEAEQTIAQVKSHGVRASSIRADVSSDPHVRRVISKIKHVFKRLDVIVNMASVYKKTPYASLSDLDWQNIMATNLRTVHLTVKHAAPLLKARGGRVINFADWVAASGRPRYKDFVPYYTAKMGVIGLTQALALELAPRVLVNAIAPGPILPPQKISNEEVRDVKRVTPLGKWGGSLEIAKTVLFLCETDFVTGECIRVDGGRHLY